MKVKMLRRTLQGRGVVPAGDILDTSDNHGRELVRKGWAELVDGPGAPKVSAKGGGAGKGKAGKGATDD